MPALLVVPLHPLSNDASRVLKRLKHVLPGTFFFETAEEPFNDPILSRRIRSNELLHQTIIAIGLPKPLTLEDQAVIASQSRCPDRPQRPEPGETGDLHGSLRLLRATPQSDLVADHFAVVTVDHRRQMRPAVLAAEKLPTNATRRLTVQRSMSSGDSDAIATSLAHSGPWLEGG